MHIVPFYSAVVFWTIALCKVCLCWLPHCIPAHRCLLVSAESPSVTFQLLTGHPRAGWNSFLWSCHAYITQQRAPTSCAIHQWSHRGKWKVVMFPSFSHEDQVLLHGHLMLYMERRITWCLCFVACFFNDNNQDKARGHCHIGQLSPPDAGNFLCLNLASFHHYPCRPNLVLLGKL